MLITNYNLIIGEGKIKMFEYMFYSDSENYWFQK